MSRNLRRLIECFLSVISFPLDKQTLTPSHFPLLFPLPSTQNPLVPSSSIHVLVQHDLPVRPAGKEPGLRGVPADGHDADLLGDGVAPQDLDGYDQGILH